MITFLDERDELIFGRLVILSGDIEVVEDLSTPSTEVISISFFRIVLELLRIENFHERKSKKYFKKVYKWK